MWGQEAEQLLGSGQVSEPEKKEFLRRPIPPQGKPSVQQPSSVFYDDDQSEPASVSYSDYHPQSQSKQVPQMDLFASFSEVSRIGVPSLRSVSSRPQRNAKDLLSMLTPPSLNRFGGVYGGAAPPSIELAEIGGGISRLSPKDNLETLFDVLMQHDHLTLRLLFEKGGYWSRLKGILFGSTEINFSFVETTLHNLFKISATESSDEVYRLWQDATAVKLSLEADLKKLSFEHRPVMRRGGRPLIDLKTLVQEEMHLFINKITEYEQNGNDTVLRGGNAADGALQDLAGFLVTGFGNRIQPSKIKHFVMKVVPVVAMACFAWPFSYWYDDTNNESWWTNPFVTLLYLSSFLGPTLAEFAGNDPKTYLAYIQIMALCGLVAIFTCCTLFLKLIPQLNRITDPSMRFPGTESESLLKAFYHFLLSSVCDYFQHRLQVKHHWPKANVETQMAALAPVYKSIPISPWNMAMSLQRDGFRDGLRLAVAVNDNDPGFWENNLHGRSFTPSDNMNSEFIKIMERISGAVTPYLENQVADQAITKEHIGALQVIVKKVAPKFSDPPREHISRVAIVFSLFFIFISYIVSAFYTPDEGGKTADGMSILFIMVTAILFFKSFFICGRGIRDLRRPPDYHGQERDEIVLAVMEGAKKALRDQRGEFEGGIQPGSISASGFGSIHQRPLVPVRLTIGDERPDVVSPPGSAASYPPLSHSPFDNQAEFSQNGVEVSVFSSINFEPGESGESGEPGEPGRDI